MVVFQDMEATIYDFSTLVLSYVAPLVIKYQVLALLLFGLSLVGILQTDSLGKQEIPNKISF